MLITVESLRPDHVGAYGGGSRSRPDIRTTPAIDALANEAVVYDNAHSVTSWTLASHASIFTGLYPIAHQTRHSTDRLQDSYQTLAERMRDSGYDTAGVISGPYLRKAHNLNQGFAHYHDEISSASMLRSHGETTSRQMLDTLRDVIDHELDPARPFLLFAYFWDPHYDYVPPKPYDSMFVDSRSEPINVHRYETTSTVNASTPPRQLAYVLSQYDGEIRWTDDHLGKFFSFLRERGLWENTVVVLTADHGEEFFEHGEKGHYRNIYRETVHVPLIVKYADSGRPGHDNRLVSLVDIVPTVLDLAGIPKDGPLDGRSLLDPVPFSDRSIFYDLVSVWKVHVAEPPGSIVQSFVRGFCSFWRYYGLSRESPTKLVTHNWSGVRQGDYKLVLSPELQRVELFNVATDAGERDNLAAEVTDVTAKLTTQLHDWKERQERIAHGFGIPEDAHLSDEEAERLRSLGYIQ